MFSAPGVSEAAQLVHVGRQPIYDLARQVYGYELLFRGPTETSADRGGTFATGQVIVNAFTEFGVPELVGDRMCFLNLTRHFLVGELPLPFGPDQVVLEVLETVAVDDAVVAGVVDLVDRGYRIALDDFIWGSGHEKLLDVASYVKLDMLDTDPDTLRTTARDCRAYPNVELVAERVETPAHLALAEELGCRLFQGYLLGRPRVLSTQALSPSRLGRVRLMAALLRDDVETKEIVATVSRDPALSFRLLGACNSAAAGLVRTVSSVHEAVVLLGTARVREWVSLMALNDIADADEAQVVTAVTQARMAQLIAERQGQPGEPAFTGGLLMGVASLLGVPVGDLVDRLPLAPQLAEALASGTGPLGRVLAAVAAYADAQAANGGEIPLGQLSYAYLVAAGWSMRALEGVLGRRRAG